MFVVCLTMLASACDEGESKKPSRGSRVNAVEAKPAPEAPAPEEFCDVYHAAGEGPEFDFPPLEQKPPAAQESGWRWVNIWATWCVPCVEEMPLLARWQKELASQGLADVVLISADDTQEEVDAFREEHPVTPDGVRVTSPDELGPWFVSMSLDGGSPLPVHLFVDDANQVRCLRAGGVGEGDEAAIVRLLGE
jgi:thiol-disulfide isomerase/thioredoxin